jgi:hypothetical protein
MGKMASAAVVRRPGGPYTIRSVSWMTSGLCGVCACRGGRVCHYRRPAAAIMVPMPAVVVRGAGVVGRSAPASTM